MSPHPPYCQCNCTGRDFRCIALSSRNGLDSNERRWNLHVSDLQMYDLLPHSEEADSFPRMCHPAILPLSALRCKWASFKMKNWFVIRRLMFCKKRFLVCVVVKSSTQFREGSPKLCWKHPEFIDSRLKVALASLALSSMSARRPHKYRVRVTLQSHTSVFRNQSNQNANKSWWRHKGILRDSSIGVTTIVIATFFFIKSDESLCFLACLSKFVQQERGTCKTQTNTRKPTNLLFVKLFKNGSESFVILCHLFTLQYLQHVPPDCKILCSYAWSRPSYFQHVVLRVVSRWSLSSQLESRVFLICQDIRWLADSSPHFYRAAESNICLFVSFCKKHWSFLGFGLYCTAHPPYQPFNHQPSTWNCWVTRSFVMESKLEGRYKELEASNELEDLLYFLKNHYY